MFYLNPEMSAADLAAHVAVLEEHGVAFVIGFPETDEAAEAEGDKLKDSEAEFLCRVICERANKHS